MRSSASTTISSASCPTLSPSWCASPPYLFLEPLTGPASAEASLLSRALSLASAFFLLFFFFCAHAGWRVGGGVATAGEAEAHGGEEQLPGAPAGGHWLPHGPPRSPRALQRDQGARGWAGRHVRVGWGHGAEGLQPPRAPVRHCALRAAPAIAVVNLPSFENSSVDVTLAYLTPPLAQELPQSMSELVGLVELNLTANHLAR